MSEQETETQSRRQSGFLGAVERIGNLLPDPVMIFVWLILTLVVLSVLGAALGWSASIPFDGEEAPQWATLSSGRAVFSAESLVSEANVTRFLQEMPRTLTGFAPLGLVLLVMFGAAVAERAGLFSALIRGGLRDAPRALLTPSVVLIGFLAHYASDAAYIIYIPLAALIFAAAGRHPLAGLAAAFAAVSGGFAGNFTPSQTDILLFGFTQEAARIIDPAWTMNPLGNWWFTITIVLLFTPITWAVTDLVIEPRLGPWRPNANASGADVETEISNSALTAAEKRGLLYAAIAALCVIAGFSALALWPGYTPLIDETAAGPARMQPFYGSLIAGMMILFLSVGVAFGLGAGTIESAENVVTMMTDGIRTMAPYIVFALFAAHFVAMFNWSRLGPITAIHGAEFLKSLNLPAPILMVSVLGFSSFLDLFIGSASAKWSALAPVVVPMFMLIGVSPEMTTAAYRMGDSFTNIMTPLMTYFPLVLAFARRWDSSMGVGSLLALMLPYALSFMAIGVAMTAAWMALELPLGPGASVRYVLPAAFGAH